MMTSIHRTRLIERLAALEQIVPQPGEDPTTALPDDDVLAAIPMAELDEIIDRFLPPLDPAWAEASDELLYAECRRLIAEEQQAGSKFN